MEDTNVDVIDGKLVRSESKISEVRLHEGSSFMTIKEAEMRNELMKSDDDEDEHEHSFI